MQNRPRKKERAGSHQLVQVYPAPRGPLLPAPWPPASPWPGRRVAFLPALGTQREQALFVSISGSPLPPISTPPRPPPLTFRCTRAPPGTAPGHEEQTVRVSHGGQCFRESSKSTANKSNCSEPSKEKRGKKLPGDFKLMGKINGLSYHVKGKGIGEKTTQARLHKTVLESEPT